MDERELLEDHTAYVTFSRLAAVIQESAIPDDAVLVVQTEESVSAVYRVTYDVAGRKLILHPY